MGSGSFFWRKRKRRKKKGGRGGGGGGGGGGVESKSKETGERKVEENLKSRHSLLASSPPTPILHTWKI